MSTAQAFDAAVLSGNFTRAYAYVDAAEAHCTLVACFAPLANIAYGLGKGAKLQVTAPEVSGDEGTVEETLLRGSTPIYKARGAFFTASDVWYWHWNGTRWQLDAGPTSAPVSGSASPGPGLTPSSATPVVAPSPSATAASMAASSPLTAIPTAEATAVPTQQTAGHTPGAIPTGWCGVRLRGGDAVLLIKDTSAICSGYWVQNNHLAIGGSWELATDIPLDDTLVCQGRLGNAATPFEVWDTGDQYWGHLLCKAYQQQ